MKTVGFIVAFFGAFCIWAASAWSTLAKTPTGSALSTMGFILIISGITIISYRKKK